MRYYLAWGTAYAFTIASTLLACLYSFMSAVGVAAYGKALILGLVAYGGCHGPMYIVKLKRSVGWWSCGLATVATLVCLVVTLLGGLGTIVGGGADIRAERVKASHDVARDRETLKRLRAERDALPHSRPSAVVSSDITTARASPLYKTSDGCDPEKITGPRAREHCARYRQLEGELAASRVAASLDAEIAATDNRLSNARPTPEDDPQAAALSALTGFTLEFSRAAYAFLASIGCELMGMVAMLAAWTEQRQTIAGATQEQPNPEAVIDFEMPPARPRRLPRPTPIKLAPAPAPIPIPKVFGSVKKWAAAEIASQPNERLEVRALLSKYQVWCQAGGVPAAPLDRFLDEIDAIFEIQPGDGNKVYALNVRLAA